MTHRAVEQYDDGTLIEVVVTHEGVIADTYRNEGLVHTGTWAMTFNEMYEMITIPTCQCDHCQPHTSDCAVHGFTAEPCNCRAGIAKPKEDQQHGISDDTDHT